MKVAMSSYENFALVGLVMLIPLPFYGVKGANEEIPLTEVVR